MEGLEHVKELLKDYFKDELNREDEENDIFYVNTCHICHCLEREKHLKRCSSCHMISYCGTDHQAKHWPSHRKLCRIVKHIISKNNSASIFGKTKGLNKQDWVKVKMNAMLIVSLKLGRNLSPSEKNMFKFPRICCFCHESDPTALTNCLSCGNSSFCNEHILDTRHKHICPTFFLIYSLDLLKIFTDKISICEIVSALLNANAIDFVPYSQKILEISSMREFIDTFFKEIINIRRGISRPEFWETFISEYFTRPLTLISAMKLMNFEQESELIVHILGSNYIELNEINAWEILFHLNPKIQRLKIVLIGPELCNDTTKPSICEKCVFNEKVLEVEVHNHLYHDFVDKTTKPSLIIGYNLGISEFENPGSTEDTWEPTVFKIAENKVPFVLTSYTAEEAKKEHERMYHFLGNITNNFSFQMNQFAGLKPFRDFQTEGVFYQNHYFIVYNNLQNVE